MGIIDVMEMGDSTEAKENSAKCLEILSRLEKKIDTLLAKKK